MTHNIELTEARVRAYVSALADRPAFAFVAVISEDPTPDHAFGVGIAVANEGGYFPVPTGWAAFATMDAAGEAAERANREWLELDSDAELGIVASTMGGRRYYPDAA